ncbi:MAG: hypothetical protein AAF418_06255 [Pseudomonadota bacterium]
MNATDRVATLVYELALAFIASWFQTHDRQKAHHKNRFKRALFDPALTLHAFMPS